MASVSYKILLTVLFQILVMIQPSSSNELVNKVCIYTNDPKSCIKMLNSDPRTPGADLNLLGEITIDLGLVLATNVSNLIIWKNRTTTDGTLKQLFNSCFDDYDFAKDALVNASSALKSKSYEAMKNYGSAAGFASLHCRNMFNQPPVRQSPILVENVDFFHVCQAVGVISHDLEIGFAKKLLHV